MKMVWSPEAALKAYIDTVKACELLQESSAAELLSAMAAGWNAQLVVETWSRGGATATSTGLSVATHQTGGRHICIVPDEELRSDYEVAMGKSGQLPEVMVGQPGAAIMEGLDGIDFLVVDCRSNNFASMLSAAKLSHRGAVLICKNASSMAASDFRWRSVLGGRYRINRSVFLPVGKGLDIAYVCGGSEVSGKRQSNWIKHVDRRSGEEFLIRK